LLCSFGGRSPETRVALATAWVEVGPVINRNSPITKSLKVINVSPEYTPMPINKRITPAESVIDAACSRDQKSGNL